MQEAAVVIPSKSPYSSPVVLVRKKDGTIRFCIDYQNLNENTKPDTHPVPRVKNTLDSFHVVRGDYRA